MFLLSFNRSLDLDEIGSIYCTNFCLSLVAGKGIILVMYGVTWPITASLMIWGWFQGVSSSSSCWHKLVMKLPSKISLLFAFPDCSCHTTVLQAPEGAWLKGSKDSQQRWHQPHSGSRASWVKADVKGREKEEEEEKKSEEKGRWCSLGGRDERGFSSLLTFVFLLRPSLLNSSSSYPPTHACRAVPCIIF